MDTRMEWLAHATRATPTAPAPEPEIVPATAARVPLQGKPRTPWTAAEDDALRRAYKQRRGLQAACRAIPYRTRTAIRARAQEIGAGRRRRVWTPQEDVILTRAWQEMEPRSLRAALGGRTWTGIYQRAKELALPMGVPQGYVPLKAAAQACGVARATLVHILAWAGVRVWRAYPCPKGREHGRTLCVDPLDAERATVRYDNAETLYAAAWTRGMNVARLRAALIADGHMPASRPLRTTLRFDSAVIDATIARHGIKATRRPMPARRAA